MWNGKWPFELTDQNARISQHVRHSRRRKSAAVFDQGDDVSGRLREWHVRGEKIEPRDGRKAAGKHQHYPLRGDTHAVRRNEEVLDDLLFRVKNDAGGTLSKLLL